MINSIKKGKKWERKVANYLTEWTGVDWHRVPQSGATATANDISMVQMQGDVFTEAEDYKDVCVECKATGKDISLKDLANSKSQIYDWIKQAREESNSSWILFFKIDYKGEYVLVDVCDVLAGFEGNTLRGVWKNTEYILSLNGDYDIAKI